MKIDLPMPPGRNASMADIDVYLNRLREMIIYIADQMNKPEPEEEE